MASPRIAKEIVEGFRALGDLTGTTSDVLDQLGIAGAVPGSVLRPSDPRARIVSSLGGISATIGKRQGELGAIVDGGARDVDHSRGIGYPIW